MIELLTVIAVLGILASLLLPALSKAQEKAISTKCLNNLRQLQVCWQMYVGDHSDYVPPNRSMQTSGVWRSTADSWIGESSALYDTTTRGVENGLLFNYDYNRSVALCHCPADESRVRSPGGTFLTQLRTRSYSMSGCLGGNYSTNKEPETAIRASEIEEPASLFVFIDEQEDSIDDAHFLVWRYPDDRWANLPADRHGQAGCLSFADGHVERWRWKWPKQFRNKQSYWKRTENAADLADLRRLQDAYRQMMWVTQP